MWLQKKWQSKTAVRRDHGLTIVAFQVVVILINSNNCLDEQCGLGPCPVFGFGAPQSGMEMYPSSDSADLCARIARQIFLMDAPEIIRSGLGICEVSCGAAPLAGG